MTFENMTFLEAALTYGDPTMGYKDEQLDIVIYDVPEKGLLIFGIKPGQALAFSDAFPKIHKELKRLRKIREKAENLVKTS